MISRGSFEFVRETVARGAGIRVEKGTEYLIESRLLPLAREHRAASVNEFIRLLQSGKVEGAEQILVEALVDTETCFFRDARPFDALRRTIFPELIEKRSQQKKLSVWCIGCSTGQEPYSIALLLHEHFSDLESWQLEIVGSDISFEALRVAQGRRYNQIEVNRGLPVTLLVKYFQKEELDWRLKDEVCRRVQFYQMNLMGTWPPLRGCDVILLRYVIGGFAPDFQKQILRKIHGRLNPEGYLLLGNKEAPPALHECFDQVRLEKAIVHKAKPGEFVAEEAEAVSSEAGKTGVGASASAASEAPPASAAEEEHLAEVGRSVREPFAKAFNETFVAMLSNPLEPLKTLSQEDSWSGQTVLTTVRFAGDPPGLFHMRIKPQFSLELAEQVLGLPPENVGLDVVKDMMNQVMQIVANNAKADLETAGIDWKFESVEVSQPGRFQLDLPAKVTRESLIFKYQQHPILVDLLIGASK